MEKFDFVTANDDSLEGALEKLKNKILDKYGEKDWSIINCFSLVQMKVITNMLQGGQPAMVPIFHITALLEDTSEWEANQREKNGITEIAKEYLLKAKEAIKQSECDHKFDEPALHEMGGELKLSRQCLRCGLIAEI